jgi:hypothetical protein
MREQLFRKMTPDSQNAADFVEHGVEATACCMKDNPSDHRRDSSRHVNSSATTPRKMECTHAASDTHRASRGRNIGADQ